MGLLLSVFANFPLFSNVLFSIKDMLFFSVSLKPYNQKEPPVVRVVEGPLFSEVVAYYQHFQQAIRIYNVPGKYTNANQIFYLF